MMYLFGLVQHLRSMSLKRIKEILCLGFWWTPIVPMHNNRFLWIYYFIGSWVTEIVLY